ncbi:M1 family aminopeptidase [Thermoactinomyces sp. DSM 45892]|uniref:M1 family aminopeptidase n=1 Tax=Thermoactinomyces sp. DSM 45892 TaxID=1882753 RepID=UPI0011607C63
MFVRYYGDSHPRCKYGIPHHHPNGGYSNKTTKLSFVHELAHQWFYGMIGNDPYENPALDEGFAVFADQYFHEYDTKGKNGFVCIFSFIRYGET